MDFRSVIVILATRTTPNGPVKPRSHLAIVMIPDQRAWTPKGFCLIRLMSTRPTGGAGLLSRGMIVPLGQLPALFQIRMNLLACLWECLCHEWLSFTLLG